MGRYVGWLLNAGLFVLACFLVASTANAILGSLLAPPPGAPAPAAPAATPVAPASRTWADRQVILDRNLFNSSTLAPPPKPEPEELEETELPLRLLGTAAHVDPDQSWAAVENLEQREAVIVRVNDEVADGAPVVRIERGRIVIREDGEPRELAMAEGDDGGDRPGLLGRNVRLPRRPRASAADRRRWARRVRQLAEDRFEVERKDVEDVVQNPASLLSQARVLPKYEDGKMVGLQVNAIKPDSVFQSIGMKNGEVITELNGIRIDSPEQGQRILSEFRDNSNFSVIVSGPEGERTLEFSAE